jgi:signal peptidase I
MCYPVGMANALYEYSYRLRREFHIAIVKVVFFIAGVLICLALFLHFVLFTVAVNTDAMEPGAMPGQRVFVSPLFSPSPPLALLELRRGDMVLALPYTQPGLSLFDRAASGVMSFFTAQRLLHIPSVSAAPESPMLARILGFPGDTIFMEDFVLHIRPRGAEYFLSEFELAGSDYNIRVGSLPANWDNTLAAAGAFPQMTLGSDQYFLLCDNRPASADSRIFGVVSGARIRGRVLLRFFPFDAFSLL